jgi:hypothetical protein
MMGMRDMRKSVICVGLMFILGVALMATASASTLDFGKSNLLFAQKGNLIQNLGNSGNSDVVKGISHLVYPASFALIKPKANALYIRKINSYNILNYSSAQMTLPVSYPTITPVPEQGIGVTTVPGSSNSTLGGLEIHGANEGDWISMRSNFYDSSTGIDGIYNGLWHIDVGTTPAYWDNMALPGSYTIKIATGKGLSGVYYCETVTVLPGQTTVIKVYSSMCPLCSSC